MQNNQATNLSKFEIGLIAQFGHLMTTIQLAKLLGRSPDALRVHLQRCRNDPLSTGLNSASVKVGRRLYYRTVDVAELLKCSS